MAGDLLHLIPNRSLDQFLYLPVLVGVLVVFFFTEVYGWQFVGLVVAGYLAAIFCIQPQAGVTIIAEGVLTLGLARLVSDVLSRTGVWSTLFGRDRFFLIILLSVLVRQETEIVLLPAISDFLARHWGIETHLERNYFSVALVLVPLVANSFWNLSFKRGAVQLFSSVAITFLILKLVFLPTGILSLSRLELVYLDYELSFRALAKAYILLLVGAVLASRANVRWGWDYNGIVVPALLALCWITPLRFAATLVEAVILYAVVDRITGLAVLKTTNLEGPRKMVLVYTLSVALKLIAAKFLAEPFLGFSFADFFGFGHLLPSLIAVKMLDRRGEARTILLPVVATSAVAFVLGSAIGLGLDAMLPAPKPPEALQASAPTRTLLGSPEGIVELAIARSRSHANDTEDLALTAEERRDEEALWRDLGAWLKTGGASPPPAVAAAAKSLGLLIAGAGRSADTRRSAVAVFEAEETLARERGFVTLLLFPGAPGPIVTVGSPRQSPEAAEAALEACERSSCRMIAFDEENGGGSEARLRAAFGALEPIGEKRPEGTHAISRIAGPLEPLLLERAARADSYRAPSDTELAVLEFAARSLLEACALEDKGARERALDRAAARAATLGMAIDGARDGFALHETGNSLGWGALFVRAGRGTLGVEVPRPRHDHGAIELGADLFALPETRAVLLAGGALQGDVDGDPDPTRFERVRTPFEAMHEALVREMPHGVLASVRSLAGRRASGAEVVIGLGTPVDPHTKLPGALDAVFSAGGPLAWLSPHRRLADGGVATAGLEGAGNPQIDFAHAIGGATTVLLWLDDAALEAHADAGFRATRARFAAAGIPFAGSSAREALLVPALGPAPGTSATLLRSVSDLAGLARHPTDPGFFRSHPENLRVRTGWSTALGGSWIELEGSEKSEVLRALVRPESGSTEIVRVEADDADAATRIDDALARGAGTILLHGGSRTVAGGFP